MIWNNTFHYCSCKPFSRFFFKYSVQSVANNHRHLAQCPAIVVFQERGILLKTLYIDGFSGAQTLPSQCRSGGVSIFVRTYLKKIFSLSFIDEIWEVCPVKITMGNHSLFVIGIYCPTGGDRNLYIVFGINIAKYCTAQ